MTKAELQKLNSDMAKYLAWLCRYSDTAWDGRRSAHAEKCYQKARKLIARAGIKYDPQSKGQRAP